MRAGTFFGNPSTSITDLHREVDSLVTVQFTSQQACLNVQRLDTTFLSDKIIYTTTTTENAPVLTAALLYIYLGFLPSRPCDELLDDGLLIGDSWATAAKELDYQEHKSEPVVDAAY